jgi:DNA-binding PadR family transcriptional regulator
MVRRSDIRGTLLRLAKSVSQDDPADDATTPAQQRLERSLPDIAYVTLGYLRKFPDGLHGYRLAQVLVDPLAGVAHLPLGRLYRLLHRLERAGLVQRALDTHALRLRHRFRPTARGEARFQRWLARSPESTTATPEPLLQRLCFADAAPREVVEGWLEQASAACQQRLDDLATYEPALYGDGYLRIVRARLEEEQRWIERIRAIVQPASGAGEAPPRPRGAGNDR